MQALARREPESIGPMVLAEIKVLFDAEAGDKLSSEGVCEKLAEMEGRPWADFGKARKPISKNQLARILKDFKIAPDNLRIGDRVVKGYRRHQFEDAWATYLAPIVTRGVHESLHRNIADEMRTYGTVESASADRCVADRKSQKLSSNGHCSGVAVENEGVPDVGSVCAHCGTAGTATAPLVEAYDAGREIRLHRECIRFWNRINGSNSPVR